MLEEPQGVRPIPGPPFPPAQPLEPPKKPVWAWALLVLGVAVLLGTAVIGVRWMCWARESARRDNCKRTLRCIGLVCHLYADENDGEFPQNWQQLYPAYVDYAKLFSCRSRPSSWQDFGNGTVTEASSSYILLPGRWACVPADFFLAYEKIENHGGAGFNVLFVDAHVAWIPASGLAQFRAQLADQDARLPELRKEWEQQKKAAGVRPGLHPGSRRGHRGQLQLRAAPRALAGAARRLHPGLREA